ncbi:MULTISPECIES: alpha/beta hydrolase [Cupriavidus]|uniref:Phospholipase/Carboxylesterase n=1 Tax=Cupriavidus pinatubonensis (strain JMP 134 / LMG 1197) TaxID=264198 RepID=Q46S40_CUPPJ|nr:MULTISPECIES: dienelactone hydrolase family protein [Cupriavidus]QYY28269.1 dienelactone hydrolase family protein [Cupriavidus pinatubonensis]TPQ32885.1 phospholipase [Cupriavidus pinatubonensis]
MPELNPHLAAPLSVFGAPPRDAAMAAILVHGRGQSPALMKEMVADRCGRSDIAWFAPAAADGTWYPERFIEPLSRNEPQLSQALERLEVLSRELVTLGFPYESQVLIGFSQGACLCSEFVWRQDRRYGALIAFTGGLIGPPQMPRQVVPARLRTMPVLLSTCAQDPHVPLDSVQESARLFRTAGADVRLVVEPGCEHAIRDTELTFANIAMARCAPQAD